MQGKFKTVVKTVIAIYLLVCSDGLLSEVIFVGDQVSDKTLEFSSIIIEETKQLDIIGDVYVTVGGAGFSTALSQKYEPIIATYITEGDFYSILKKHGALERKGISAVFFENEVTYQYHIARMLISSGRIVAFYTDNSKRSIKKLPGVTWIPFDGDLFKALENIPSDTVAVLAVSDPQIYNRSSLRVILKHLLYKRKIPLIGYTKLMVENEAIASTVTSEGVYRANVLDALIQVNAKKIATRTWADPTNIQFNKLLARTLQIDLPNRAEAERALLALRSGTDD